MDGVIPNLDLPCDGDMKLTGTRARGRARGRMKEQCEPTFHYPRTQLSSCPSMTSKLPKQKTPSYKNHKHLLPRRTARNSHDVHEDTPPPNPLPQPPALLSHPPHIRSRRHDELAAAAVPGVPPRAADSRRRRDLARAAARGSRRWGRCRGTGKGEGTGWRGHGGCVG